MRGRIYLIAVAVLVLGLAVALPALAALPKKGGVYKGTIASSPFRWASS